MEGMADARMQSRPARLRETAARLVHAFFGSEAESIEQNHKGNAAAVFEVAVRGRTLMVKLYEDAQRADWFAVVVPILERVQAAGVPVPRVLHYGREQAHRAYLIYEKVRGVPADEYGGAVGELWQEVGRYIARVNRFRAPGYGRIHYGAEGSPACFRSWRAFIEPEVAQLARPERSEGLPRYDHALRRRVRERLSALFGWQFEPAVIHANITGGNIIVAPETGAVRGIIDWDEMLLARAPHFELATALLWMEEQAKAAFLDGYGMAPAAYAAIEEEVDTARLFYLTRYLLWHLSMGNEALAGAVKEEMERIVGT